MTSISVDEGTMGLSDLQVRLKYKQSEKDDWTKIEDKALRKKIQNRLAKRKSRMLHRLDVHLGPCINYTTRNKRTEGQAKEKGPTRRAKAYRRDQQHIRYLGRGGHRNRK